MQDASYVLCPTCRVINPLAFDRHGDNNSDKETNRLGGVGLGLTLTELGVVQSEMYNRIRSPFE